MLHQKNTLLVCNKIITFFLLFSLCVFNGFAQKKHKRKSSYDNPEHSSENLLGIKKGWFIGIDGGITLFYGDVALYNIFPKAKDFSKSAGSVVNLFFGKKFKYGLATEAQLFRGTLKGEKNADLLYRRYFNSDFSGYSLNIKYNLSQLLFREKNDRSFFNRLSAHLTVGGGQIYFRSRLYKLAVNNQWYLEKVSGYSSVGIDSASIASAGGLVTEKAKIISVFVLPVGGRVNFKLNQKTNVVLDMNYVTCFTDKIDSWSRNWSHKDRYFTTSIGLVYNLGTDLDSDVPDSDRFFRPTKKDSESSSRLDDGYEKSSIENSLNGKKTGLLKSSSKSKKSDKDLEVKLKLYELQLKLFEMMYLVE